MLAGTGDDHDDRHDELDGVVAGLIDELGPAVLTSSAVARRLGVSVHALRRRHGGRDALLLGHLRRTTEGLAPSFEHAASRAEGPLEAIGRAVATTLPADAEPTTVAHRVAWRIDPGSAALRAAGREHEAEFRRLTGELIERAVSAGRLTTTTLTVDELTDLVVTAYHGAVTSWLVGGDGSVRAWVVTRVERALRPHRA